ncbi:SURP and G-patch domain-containing protein 1-like isoform X2 [Brevipalpus obovatus]|uniref:SURP and G-patch domain-containing protein 1-like isoform X2 n=1 Tax=Brevipalpus obovatus TaxID=246614 RepID=UPI003D9F03B6
MSRYPPKQSRQKRWALMTQQEELIEAKRQEIEKRLKADQEALERKEAAPVKSEDSSNETKSNSQVESNVPNKFKNDGSFLEMFKKLQQQQQQQQQEAAGPDSTISKPASPSDPEPQIKSEPVDISDVNSQELETPQCTESRIDAKEDDIRSAIERSALLVAMNGPEAESDVKEKFQSEPNYKWLSDESDVNHQYYRRRIQELCDAKKRFVDETSDPASSLSDPSTSSTQSSTFNENTTKRKKTSRWGEGSQEEKLVLTKISQDPDLVKYAIKVYGKSDLTPDQWKQLEDQRKMRVLFEMLDQKRIKKERLEKADKFNYEYDSDEETEGGTWEHKKRCMEMEKTKQWADSLTEMNRGKHHIGDFLPPEELEKFMKKWDSIKDGSTSMLYEEEYKDFKLKSENTGYKMLQKLGWSEGQGLGAKESGITAPINSDSKAFSNAGLGTAPSDELTSEDDEYEAYRKRMMLAYRFRPNPMNNPRRPYY